MHEDVRRFFGKYRGVVSDTADPSNLGRIKVTLENFPAAASGWCMPCVPYAGPNVGWFVIPERGAHVWVEFEGGDPSLPIWVGCFWAPGTVPPTATPSRKIWQTPTAKIVLDDRDGTAGELEIESSQLSVTAASSTRVTTGEYSLKGATITLEASAINIG